MWHKLLTICFGACFWHGDTEKMLRNNVVDDEKEQVVEPICFMRLNHTNYPVTISDFLLLPGKEICLKIIHKTASRISKIKELWDAAEPK